MLESPARWCLLRSSSCSAVICLRFAPAVGGRGDTGVHLGAGLDVSQVALPLEFTARALAKVSEIPLALTIALKELRRWFR